jgi:hypothetical protein
MSNGVEVLSRKWIEKGRKAQAACEDGWRVCDTEDQICKPLTSYPALKPAPTRYQADTGLVEGNITWGSVSRKLPSWIQRFNVFAISTALGYEESGTVGIFLRKKKRGQVFILDISCPISYKDPANLQ